MDKPSIRYVEDAGVFVIETPDRDIDVLITTERANLLLAIRGTKILVADMSSNPDCGIEVKELSCRGDVVIGEDICIVKASKKEEV